MHRFYLQTQGAIYTMALTLGLSMLGMGTGLSLFLIGPVHAWHGLGWAQD